MRRALHFIRAISVCFIKGHEWRETLPVRCRRCGLTLRENL